MSFDNANSLLHNINQLYLNTDPVFNYNFNQYVTVFLYNCVDTNNINFLITELSNFSYQGILYSLINFSILFLNDILNNNVTMANTIINFFGRLLIMKTSNNVLSNINFSSFIRTYIVSYVKTDTTNNKLTLYNNIQAIMNNSTNYPEYPLIQTLNSSSALLQMGLITDSIQFVDTYNAFPSVGMSLNNNGVELNKNLLVNNSYTSIDQFHDNEVVNSKFIKAMKITYTTNNNTVYVNGIKGFYFK